MILKQRQQEIKDKGFNLVGSGLRSAPREFDLFDSSDYSKVRVGVRQLDDAVLNLGSYRKMPEHYGDKQFILRAIYKHDLESLRNISSYFYSFNGTDISITVFNM